MTLQERRFAQFYRASFLLACTSGQAVDGWLTNQSARFTFVIRYRNMNQLLYTIVTRPCCLTLGLLLHWFKRNRWILYKYLAQQFYTLLSDSQVPPRVRIVVAWQKYYKGLYGDFSDRYLGVKNSNTKLLCFLNIFGR